MNVCESTVHKIAAVEFFTGKINAGERHSCGIKSNDCFVRVYVIVDVRLNFCWIWNVIQTVCLSVHDFSAFIYYRNGKVTAGTYKTFI